MSKLDELYGFRSLVETFKVLAESNDDLAKLGNARASGKAFAFHHAAEWLSEEIEFYEKESR